MKCFKRILSICVLGAVTLLGLQSCTFDDSEIWDSIKDLQERIEKLEEIAAGFQSDLDALSEAVKKLENGVTVVSVTENEDGGYTIRFSDGSEAVISDGEDGVTPPAITVAEEGGVYYWAYKNADGSIEFILDGDGNKIPVTSQAPQVRINPDNNHWEISTDGGKTWKDTGVDASGSGDSLFEGIEEDEDYYYLLLPGGEKIALPKGKELSVVIDCEPMVNFSAGETKEMTITVTGAEKVLVIAPDGWTSSINGDKLSVTAPVAENVYAQKEGTVSVLATSSDNRMFVAEFGVQIVVMPKIGDYYYSDGTWSDGGLISIDMDGLNAVWAEEKPAPLPDKQVIGIVCQTFPERIAETDKAAGYTHGYVMAVKSAHGTQKNTTAWSLDYGFDCLKGAKLSDTWYNNVNGYEETMKVKDTYGDNIMQCPAFDWTVTDFPLPAPEGTSGWFLPSTGQLWDMVANFCGSEVAAIMQEWSTQSLNAEYGYASDNVEYNVIERFNQVMSKIPADQKEELFITTSEYYSMSNLWASTPCTAGETACIISIGAKGNFELYSEYIDGDCIARPILAF